MLHILKLIERKHYLMLLCVLTIGLLFVLFGWLQKSFFDITYSLDAYVETNPFLGLLLFISLSALSVMFGMFSSAPLVPSATLIWGTPMTTVYLLGGWLIGSSIAYGIGYYLGRPIVKKLVSKETADAWLDLIHKRITFMLAFIFRLATPTETGYVFGIVKYSFWKYLLITFMAELPFAIMITYAGHSLINVGWMPFAGLSVLYIIILIIAAFFLKQKLKKNT